VDLGTVAKVVAILAGFAGIGTFVLKLREHRQPPPRNAPRAALAIETAEEMVGLKALVDTGWLGVLQRGQGWWERPALADNYDALGREGRRMVARSARIDTAFAPSSAAAKAVREATEAAEEVYNALGRIRMERQDQPMNEDAKWQVRKYFQEDRDKIAAARDRFAAAQSTFAEAASPPT
jgi:hypothetical protein